MNPRQFVKKYRGSSRNGNGLLDAIEKHNNLVLSMLESDMSKKQIIKTLSYDERFSKR